MSFRRLGWVAAIAAVTLLEISCGQVYRPVVIPINTTPPNSSNFHAVFGISVNAPFSPGTALQIDVSGDSDIGAANMGVNPTHAGILPNNGRVIVASAGSLFTGDADLVSIFTEATDSSIATGLGVPTTATLPSGSLPDFVNTTDNLSVYVANFGTNSVTALTSTALIRQTVPVGSQPVALAETPDTRNLYVVNQGDNTVTDLFPQDLSTLAVISVGSRPVWAVPRVDGQRLYVVTQGDGNLFTINTSTNVLMSSESVGGAGASYASYDKSRNRLYVTNPSSGSVYVFDATQDPPKLLGALTVPAPAPAAAATNCASYTCTYGPVTPVSVAALPDGSRFYVASYVTGTATCLPSDTCYTAGNVPPPACPDVTVANPGCVIPQVTVYDAASLTVKTTVFPLLVPVAGVQSFAVTPVPYCAPVLPYNPSSVATLSARFRMSAAAAADSSRVYASICDGGSIAIVNTTTSSIATGTGNTPDTLVNDLFTPFSAGPTQPNGEPLTQNPIFLLTGQ